MAAVERAKVIQSIRIRACSDTVPLYCSEHNGSVMESCMSSGQQNHFTVQSDLLGDIISSISEAPLAGLRGGRMPEGIFGIWVL